MHFISGRPKTAEEYNSRSQPYDLWNYLDIQSYVIREIGNVRYCFVRSLSLNKEKFAMIYLD